MTFERVILEPSPRVRRVEELANECIDQCMDALGIDECPLPIPVENWIERPLSIHFGIADLTEYGPDVLGATFIDANEILVSDKLVSNPARLRFTAAHELGHYRMHGSQQTHFRETESQGPGSPIQIERQADRFAAAFLMPADAVLPEVLHALKYFDLDIERCSTMLTEDSAESSWLWRHRILPRLTQAFEVSVAAMLHRFTELRTPEGRPFMPSQVRSRLLTANPTEVALVVRDGVPRPTEATNSPET